VIEPVFDTTVGEEEDIGKPALPILIVDDESDFRYSISMVLRSAGHTTLEAASGNEALELLRHSKAEEGIGLVILDIWMPDISGIQVIHELNKEGFSVPVLAISGYADDMLVRELGDMGCVGFIAKPFMPEKLLGKVREVLG